MPAIAVQSGEAEWNWITVVASTRPGCHFGRSARQNLPTGTAQSSAARAHRPCPWDGPTGIGPNSAPTTDANGKPVSYPCSGHRDRPPRQKRCRTGFDGQKAAACSGVSMRRGSVDDRAAARGAIRDRPCPPRPESEATYVRRCAIGARRSGGALGILRVRAVRGGIDRALPTDSV